MPPRRFTTFVVLIAVGLVALFVLSSSSRHVASEAIDAVKEPAILQGKLTSFDIPDFHFSFHKSGHKPPEQNNSRSGDTSWHSDWRWLNPFSSSLTLDEDRSVLPPLPERPYVYTYYDTSVTQEQQASDIDKEILLTWRRAWWAKGFRPVVLTQAEATNNPMYVGLHEKGMQKSLEDEFIRWMAWSHMGNGIFASWLCLPMAEYDDPTLVYLRRSQYEQLTRFEGLGGGLFMGTKAQIDHALRDALSDARLSTYKNMVDAVKSDFFKVLETNAFAYYDAAVVEKKYSILAKQIIDDPDKGRRNLVDLIHTHLHTIWQNTFSSGIAVLKPLPAHTTALVQPALHLAQLLTECHESILPSSCPPNRPKCNPCVGTKMMITQPGAYKNRSSVYNIGTVPHPYTMIALNNQSDAITVAHVRRHTDRDTWIYAVTRDILGDGRGGPSRVVGLKDAVASEYSRGRSLWFTVEQFPAELTSAKAGPERTPSNDVEKEPERRAPFPENWLESIDWHFGFPVPRTTASHGESMNPVPLPERWQKGQAGVPEAKRKSYDPPAPDSEQFNLEIELLRKSRITIKSKELGHMAIRGVAEKWNLSDMEVWRFIRAFKSRSEMERKLWAEEEASYSGTGSARKSGWW